MDTLSELILENNFLEPASETEFQKCFKQDVYKAVVSGGES
jgi:hypothetical protein